MQTLQIDKTKAFEAYNNPQLVKDLLEQSFGKEYFSQKITDRIKSIHDALTIKGLSLADLVNENDPDHLNAYRVLSTVIEILNEGWKPDWSDHSQSKYTVCYQDNGSGLVFDYVFGWFRFSIVGSRLCLRSRELGELAAKILDKYYKDYLGS
jgi:hypothetical protein